MNPDVALDLSPIPTEFVSELERLVPPKELNFPRAEAFGEFNILFPVEARTHPAKMSTELLDYLIRTYTKPGETILDPFGGTGSTAVVAAYRGRNGIAVELEERFAEWARESQRRLECLPGRTGKMVVIQGDSRNLTKLLQDYVSTQVTEMVLSPPFADGEFWFEPKMHRRYVSPNHKGRKAWEVTGQGDLRAMRPDNIARLKLREVSLIATSLPFADTKKGGDADVEEMVKAWDRHADPKWRTGMTYGTPGRVRGLKSLGSGYSSSPENIGNLPLNGVDVEISSPVFFSTKQERFPPTKRGNRGHAWSRKLASQHRGVDRTFTSDPRNIENVSELGGSREPVDVEMMSPPFESSLESGSRHTGGISARDSRMAQTGRYMDGGSTGGNIGDLKLKDIGTSIASLPFGSEGPFHDMRWLKANADHKLKDRIAGKRVSKFYSPEAETRYLEKIGASLPLHPASIGKLEVHAAVTSPSFGRANEGGGIAKRGYIGKRGVKANMHESLERKFSDDSKNLSNLPMRGGRTETYQDAVLRVYREMFKLLKPGGRSLVEIKAFTRNRENVDLPYITWKLLEQAGFVLEELLKVRLRWQSFWRVIQYQKNPDLPQLRHQYVLVCRKPK